MYCIWMTLHLLDSILLWILCFLLLSPCKHLSLNPFCATWRTKELFSDTFYNQLSFFSQSDKLKKKERERESWYSFLKHISLTSFRDPYLHLMLEHGRKQRLKKKTERDKLWTEENWKKGQKWKIQQALYFSSIFMLRWLFTHWAFGRCSAFENAKHRNTLQTKPIPDSCVMFLFSQTSCFFALLCSRDFRQNDQPGCWSGAFLLILQKCFPFAFSVRSCMRSWVIMHTFHCRYFQRAELRGGQWWPWPPTAGG